MKYRLIKGLVGISTVMLLATGCESGKKAETEAVSLEIADMAVVDESESESESETGTEAETELQTEELDLSETEPDKAGKKDSGALLEESESETEATTEPAQPETKKGKAQTKATEKETEAETVKQTEKTISKKQSGSNQKQSETAAQTEKMSEETLVQSQSETTAAVKTGTKQTEQTEAEQKMQDAGSQTEERKGSAVTEAATERETLAGETKDSEAMTESETEAKSEKQTEVGSAGQSKTETKAETDPETAAKDATGVKNGAAAETEKENNTDTKNETESEQETETEAATEQVAAATPQLRVINDQIIVRSEASTESEKLATLTPGMLVIAIQEDGEWTQIRFQSPDGFEDGYVKTQYLNDLDQLRKVKEKINVRKEADKESAKLGELNAGELVLVTGTKKQDWSAILHQADGETVTAYVMTEFLEPVDVDTLENSIVGEEERILREGLEPESEAETEVETESETETETETESESETETEAVTEAESESESETEVAAETETESETETKTEVATEVGTELETEEATEAATESETTTEAETATENVTESATETETEQATEVATEEGSEAESVAESESKTSAGSLTFASSQDAQFALTKQLFPEASTVGVIYSADNKRAKTELADYEALAKEYGYELVTTEVTTAEDIDFAASELVGEVDGVFCMDDATLNDLMQTICAYADEVEIPVLGVQKEQVESGCLAAYDGTLYWNATEAGKLGKSVDTLSGNVVTVD